MASFDKIGEYRPNVPISDVGHVEQKDAEIGSDKVEKSQGKLKFALVDSGMGGGMTAAFLKGEVRQLGSYFCLPIGDKKPAQAEAYTAAMALWPLIMPLANDEGQFDGRVAENVIIACNSASVRKEGAVDLMADFCDKALKSDFRDLPQNVKSGMRSLFAAVNQECHGVTKDHFKEYFTAHVHEIVSKTAEQGAVDAVRLLKGQDKSKDPLLVRVDSTNGTAGSESYPTKIIESLNSGTIGGCDNPKLLGSMKTETEGDPSYVITHHVVEVIVDDVPRTIVIEGRGNPPWVAAIESGAEEKTRSNLVGESNEKSMEALKGASLDKIILPEGVEEANGALKALTTIKERGEKQAPGLSMLCCTHYPAMAGALAGNYEGPTEFINQATIVKKIADRLQPDEGEPEPLRLALTVGSMNYGGARGAIRPSIADPEKTARTLGEVLEKTMDGSNTASLDSVQVFSQGKPLGKTETIESYDSTSALQKSFESIHRMMVTSDDAITRLYAEQNLERNPDYWPGSNNPPFTFVENDKREYQVKPNDSKLSGSALEIREKFSESSLGTKLNTLGVLMTLGESRGIDKIAPLNDQGLQLQTATAHLMDVINSNKDKQPEEKERVGILTGFTVVNNDDRTRVEGENDGPPGAVIMGKAIVDAGTPVVFVTDHSAEASLLSSLLAADLAELIEGAPEDHSKLKLEHVKLGENVSVEIPEIEVPAELPGELTTKDVDERKEEIERRHAANRGAVLATTQKLHGMKVGTMISIERPSVTQLDGGIYSMLGIDVAPFNPDLSPTLGTETFKPFTIGIGDGGNELGTGGIQFMTSEARDEQLLPFVTGGSVIGAKAELATDVMLLSTVSNNGGIAISMALQAGLASPDDLPSHLDGVVDTYNGIIQHLKDHSMSFDGVSKKNLLTVDGRRLGTRQDAESRWQKDGWDVPLGVGPTGEEGADGDTTHNDTFLKFKQTLLA